MAGHVTVSFSRDNVIFFVPPRLQIHYCVYFFFVKAKLHWLLNSLANFLFTLYIINAQ